MGRACTLVLQPESWPQMAAETGHDPTQDGLGHHRDLVASKEKESFGLRASQRTPSIIAPCSQATPGSQLPDSVTALPHCVPGLGGK